MEDSGFELFDSTDVTKDPMEIVNRVLISRMDSLLASMYQETHLCDEFSAGIVEEFLFKGNKLEVEFQLRKLIEYRKQTPYEEKDRILLVLQSERFSRYVKLISDNPIRTEIRKLNIRLWSSYKSDIQFDIDKLYAQLKFNQTIKHNHKECICYNNF